jgi:hypothetical protein
MEAPLLHSRLRKNFLAGEHPFLCFSFGVPLEPSSFPIFSLGHSLKNLRAFMEGRSGFWSRLLFDSTSIFCKSLDVPLTLYDKCSFFIGAAFLHRRDCAFIFNSVTSFMHQHRKVFYFSFNVVSPFLGRISTFELGALPGVHGASCLAKPYRNKSFLYLLGTDAQAYGSTSLAHGFTVYQGSFFEHSSFFDSVHLLLPVSIYVERVSSFINMEGLFRRTSKAITPYRFIYADWEILQALSYYKLSFFSDSFSFVTDFAFFKEFFSKLVDYACLFFFNITEHSFKGLYMQKVVVPSDWFFFNHGALKIFNSVAARPFNHYYGSEHFSRHSKILSLCFTKVDMPGFLKDLSFF